MAVLIAAGPVRSIGLLVGGTSAAHAITAVTMPINSRLYTPHDFTVAAAFTSLLAMISVIACLRFDLAIPLPEDETEAANLFAIAVASAVGAALLTAVALAVLPSSALGALSQPDLLRHLWMLPFAVLIAGTYLALQMWFVRTKNFASIARSRIAQSALAAGAQIGMGIAGRGPLGLIVGQTTNYGAAAFILGGATLLRDRRVLRTVSISGMAAAARQHRQFPRYSVAEALANAASIYAPMLVIAAAALGPEAGYLTLAMFLLQAPMAVLGTSVGQVFLADAPEAHRAGRLDRHTLASLAQLLRIALPPLAFLAIVSPATFGLVFGAPWARAGLLVSWMVPWFLMQFLTSPVSTALLVLSRQGTAMALQLTGLILRLGTVVMATRVAPAWTSEAYAVSGFVFYAIYLAVVVRVVGIRLTDLASPLRRALPLTFAAVCVGVIVAFAIAYVR